MSVPQLIPNCPPGLEYLATLDHLFVMQKVSIVEAFLGSENNNKFIIKNQLGQNVEKNAKVAVTFSTISYKLFYST